MVKSSITFKKWGLLNTPKQSNLCLFQFNDTNLWISKNSKNEFGLLITECYGLIEKKYKNIVIEWKAKIINYQEDKNLQNCLILNFNNDINKDILINLIESKSFKKEGKNYTTVDIIHLLNELEKIIQKDDYEYNEVIGAWGELYFLNSIIAKSNTAGNKFNIIDSWEGVSDRNIIDFTFNYINSKVEVKTTTNALRIHVFHDILQLSINNGWLGLIASICIEENEAGITCNNLFKEISDKLDPDNLNNLKKKIEIRGECCYDDNFKFSINDNKKMEFYNFNIIPKPILTDGVGKVEWESVLENVNHIDSKEKVIFFDKFNFLV
jgi:hypothetical protein